MRRVAGGLGGLVLVFLIVALSGVGDADVGVAQGSPAATTATRVAEEAELANLRTQVAALSTEAARPGREDIPQGRLGGSRAEFDIAYGPPSIYIGPDEVAYQIDQVGQVTVGFVDDRAQRLVIVPPRPPAKPATKPDPADWALAEAREIARRFAPTDATFGEDDPAAENGVVVPGTSEELAAVLAPADGTDCPPADGHRAFVVTFTAPTEVTVSVITLEVTPGLALHRLAT